jgi:hypothetical protein
MLVRDVAGVLKPQAFLSTDLDADPLDTLRWFARRRSIEVTFAEVRRHRCGNPAPMVRPRHRAHHTHPARAVLTDHPLDPWPPRHSDAGAAHRALVLKTLATFGYALAPVRREQWAGRGFETPSEIHDAAKLSQVTLNSLTSLACYAA